MSAVIRYERSHLSQIAPSIEAALATLGNAAIDTGMEPSLVGLVSLRASQINMCPFCVQYHLDALRQWRNAVPREKIDLLAAWRGLDIYSEREKAALRWTEIITTLPENGIADCEQAAVLEYFNEKELLLLTAAIGAVNVWNRIGLAFRLSPQLIKSEVAC